MLRQDQNDLLQTIYFHLPVIQRYFYTVGNPTCGKWPSNAHYLGRFHSHALYLPFISSVTHNPIDLKFSYIVGSLILVLKCLSFWPWALSLFYLLSVMPFSFLIHSAYVAHLCYDSRGSVTWKIWTGKKLAQVFGHPWSDLTFSLEQIFVYTRSHLKKSLNLMLKFLN